MSEKKNVIDAKRRIRREADKKEKEERAVPQPSYYKENIEIINKLAMLVEHYKYRSFEEILNLFVLDGKLEEVLDSEKTLEKLKSNLNEENREL